MKILKWSKPKQGFVVDCLLMTDSQICSTITFKYTLEEEDKVEQFTYALESFHSIYKKINELSFEEQIEAIAKKSKIDRNQIESWFDGLLICSNSDYGPVDEIIGYRVCKTDALGSHYGMFNKKPYKSLGKVSSSFYEGWDM